MICKRIRIQVLVCVVAAAFVACKTNPPSVKSSAAGDLKPVVGSQAVKEAAKAPVVRGGPAVGKQASDLQAIALFDGPEQPVGIAVSKAGRVFMSFPRWADPVKLTVVELVNGKVSAFPDEQTNAFDATKPDEYKPFEHLISAQAIVFDEQDRLWILDPGSFNFAPSLNRGPKLWAYDIGTRQRVKAISFPIDVAMKTTALNDVRFDLKRGTAGTAYITDSGVGGIIVVDLASGTSWRHLDGHPSVLPTPGLKAQTEGRPFLQHKASGEVDSPDFRSDGIALSPDGQTLYYTAVMSHSVYSVPTALLADRATDEQKLADAVRVVATKPSGNDGILCDAQGRIYTTDFEDNSIRRIDPVGGTVTVLTQDERLIWPDTLALHGNQLYVTVNQLARQPNYRGGKDERQPPYGLFRMNLDGSQPAP